MFNVRTFSLSLTSCAFIIFLHLSAPAQNPDPNPPADEDIRGARAPVVIPAPEKLTTTQKILLTAPLAAAAGFLIWYLMFRRTIPVMEVPPLEQAREALRGIDRGRETLPAGELAEQTANVVRQFIAAQFGIAAPQRTTEEFLKSLTTGRNSLLQPQLETLEEFLTTCDKAKFAGTDFDPVERFALLESAGRFIQSAARHIAPAAPAP